MLKSQAERIEDCIKLRRKLKEIGFHMVVPRIPGLFVHDMNRYVRDGVTCERDVSMTQGFILSYTLKTEVGADNTLRLRKGVVPSP